MYMCVLIGGGGGAGGNIDWWGTFAQIFYGSIGMGQMSLNQFCLQPHFWENKTLIILYFMVIYIYIYTVPEIVHVTRVNKNLFDIIEGEVQITKSSVSVNAPMEGSRDIPTLK